LLPTALWCSLWANEADSVSLANRASAWVGGSPDAELRATLRGLFRPDIQFARHMGFRTVAIGRRRVKEKLAKDLGAHVYIDTAAEDAPAVLQRTGEARAILATGKHQESEAGTVFDCQRRQKVGLERPA